MFNRHVGVTIPKDQLHGALEKGRPDTISHALEIKHFALQWFDESGKAHPDAWVKIGDQWYKPQDSEEWASKLSPVKEKYAKQLDAMLIEQVGRDIAPTEDAVDIVASKVAAAPPPDQVDV